MRPSPDRARALCVLFTLSGATLLVLGELTDLLESDMGLDWVNVTFALPIAVIVVSAVAVGGDRLLEAIERRRGRRPGRRLATPMLATLGFAGAIGIAAHHLRHAPHLDASLGLAGGTLLLIAAGLRRYATAPVKNRSPSPTLNRRGARILTLGHGSRHPPRIVRRAGNRSTTRT